MISPVVIKTAVGIAARAASDEKARNRMIVLIVTPVAFLLFVISFSLYLITNPLSVLKVFLDAEELELVEEFQIDHGYHQNLGIYENDYLQGTARLTREWYLEMLEKRKLYITVSWINDGQGRPMETVR